ncbi:hypothetical protein BV22DRAFT_1128869 [Leucogyrophana mollusca]|uniref:Uncharacterized protein n=1 Tax=Leucogyrophana mollusca TaxID=85980 RepID=A0ACB8BK22_9AGAM|nr:hypothetical protein BV22DRAFT_1128869 [Leucogyrophana mollusca]
MNFIGLPEDVLLHIFLFISIEDLLSLKQACRVLHTLGSADYLWHRLILAFDLPLDIPLGVDPASLSGRELQAIVVAALRLDHNWRKPDLHIERAVAIIRSDTSFVDGLQLLPGAKWLVTTQLTGRRQTHLTLWSLEHVEHACGTKTIDIAGRVRSFHAYYQRKDRKVVIAVAVANEGYEYLDVLHISLEDETMAPARPQPVLSGNSVGLTFLGHMHKVTVYENIVATTFVRFSPDTGQTVTHIYFYNLLTCASAIVKPSRGANDTPMITLFAHQFAVVHGHEDLVVTFYDIPPSITATTSPPSPSANSPHDIVPSNLTPVTAECHLPKSEGFYSAYVSGGLEHGAPVLAALMFHWTSDEAMIKRLTPPTTQTQFYEAPTVVSHAFYHPREQYMDHLRLGATGRRAVWVELQEPPVLKKWSFPRYHYGQPLPCGTSTLMPGFSGLPFNPKDSHVIAFDEVTCRLCVSLPSGELYVCDFL